MKKLVSILMILGLLSGCNKSVKEENDQLLVRLDSMRLEFGKNVQAADLLDQIGLYLDSIDATIKWIKVDQEAGSGELSHIQRMINLKSYLQNTEEAIVELEAGQKANTSQITRLRKEISIKNEAINELKLSLSNLDDKNTELQDLLTLSEEEREEVQSELDETGIELEKSRVEIQQLLGNMKRAQAESYYALGESMEEVARRTQFARKRKKQSLTDALKFFEQSYELGFEPAKAKADELRTKLKIV